MTIEDIKQASNRESSWRVKLREELSARERGAIPRADMPMLPGDYRISCNREVNLGLSRAQATLEATRCLDCPNPQCVTGCPVGIDIPGFIKNIQRGDTDMALAILKQSSPLPAVCGRVCPQERQCESHCIYQKMKKAPVAIGYLERYAADNANASDTVNVSHNGIKVAAVGSGPASLAFAGDMAARGFDVTVFEALHEIGGVLKYGIPEFRLPNSIVDTEIEALKRQGVKMIRDCVIGKTIGVEELIEQGYAGVFVATGAGLPRFMGIPGENYVGVMSANEYLTRINLMGAGRGGDTPVLKGRRVAVIGGGNTAMDSVRTAMRMGAERAMIVYRRSEAEMPARAEEIEHARQEGVEFLTLHNPIEYMADERGRVKSMKLQKMKLGEPDESGRQSPVPIDGATVDIDVDLVLVSVGVSPNPLIPKVVKDLEISRRGTIVVNEATMQSSMPAIYAGGDIVRGGATVILAMGDGKRAAAAMAEAIGQGVSQS